MLKRIKVFFISIFVIFTVLFFSILPSCKQSPGQDQRQVVLYCSVDQSIAEPIIAEFETHTGIKVLARFDTEASKTVGLVQRIRAEAVREKTSRRPSFLMIIIGISSICS